MSTQYPQIAGYTGTFSGSPVSINIQADHGWVAQQVVATGTADMTLSFPTGNALSIPAGIALVFGGPVNEMTLTGTVGQKYTVYASAVAGTFSVTGSSGGGGGGGGAPTTAPYLLDGASVDPALTNGVAVGALGHTLDVVRVVGSSAGAATPIKLVGSSAANPLQIGGGVELPLRQVTTAGEQTVAAIGAVWVNVTDPAHPQGALVVALGADETLSMILTTSGLTLVGNTTFKSQGGSMTLHSDSGTVSVDNGRITNLANGVANSDAATVAQARSLLLFGGYVLGKVGGGSTKVPYGFGNASVQAGGSQIMFAGTIKRMIFQIDNNFATAGSFDVGIVVGATPHYVQTIAAGVTGLQPIVVGDVAVADGDELFVYVMSSGAVNNSGFQCRIALDFISA